MFLGVILDSKLTWSNHITSIQKKISKQRGILHLIRDLLTKKCLKLFYYSLIYPQLTYCHAVWGGVPQNRTKCLQITQKKIIRSMAYLHRHDHTNDYFFNFNILKLYEVSQYCRNLYVHKCLLSQDNDMFTHRPSVRYHLRNTSHLQLPQCCSSQSQAFISFAGVQAWNSLPESLRRETRTDQFKHLLKKHLLSRYLHSSS